MIRVFFLLVRFFPIKNGGVKKILSLSTKTIRFRPPRSCPGYYRPDLHLEEKCNGSGSGGTLASRNDRVLEVPRLVIETRGI